MEHVSYDQTKIQVNYYISFWLFLRLFRRLALLLLITTQPQIPS